MSVRKAASATITALAVAGVFYAFSHVSLPRFIYEWRMEEATINIGGVAVRALVADTPEWRARGLSGRRGLNESEGMLFIFPEGGYHIFWMKDMLFPIDIVWLSADGEVVDIQHAVSPDTYPEFSFAPQIPARYVLELPTGWVVKHNMNIGDKAQF